MKTKVSACSIRTQDQWETRLKLYQLPYKYRYIWKYNFIHCVSQNSPPFGKVYIFLASYHKLAS